MSPPTMTKDEPNAARGGKSILAPRPLITRLTFIAPTLFTLLYAIFIGYSIRKLGISFLLPLAFIFGLAAVADRFVAMIDEHRATIDLSGKSLQGNVKTFKAARKKLQAYKDGYEKAIKKRDDAISGENTALKELVEMQERVEKSQIELNDSLRKRLTDYRICRKDQNDSRLAYFKNLQHHQATIIAELDKLIKRFRNVSVPKVKGVTPRKNNSNSLTGPLERLATALRNSQQVTEKNIRVAEKIKEILEARHTNVKEMYARVKEAEMALESASKAPLQLSSVDASPSGSSAAGGVFDVKLDEHYERLDAYFRGIAT